ncbi:Calx-beta domain-containing protein [Anabaena catenula]|uniref:Calx-beta domain-containing protein n=1 Tax=Anabaena catenula TaxID=1296320 RepID=UPI0018EFF697|nr:Calx-beta domain-containing protein [Anabaena catenula]
MNRIIKPLLDLTHDQLSKFANLEDFGQQFNTVFGTQYDRTVAVDLRSQSQASDFSQLPEVEILGNANGADASNSNNKIYLLDNFVASGTPEANIVPSSGTISKSGDNRIDSLVGGYRLFSSGSANVTFSFVNSTTASSYVGQGELVSELSDTIKNDVRTILKNLMEPLFGVTFTEVTETSGNYGQLRYMFSNMGGDGSYAYAYDPASDSTTSVASDVHFSNAFIDPLYNTNNNFASGPGSHGFTTLIHETAHALGLKHPGNYNGTSGTADGPYLPYNQDNLDNTVMSYNLPGNSPATLMPYDIAALRYIYGSKSFNSGSTSYNFTSTYAFTTDGNSPTTWGGAANQKITLVDDGGIDTLNFSALPSNASGYRFDMNPGGVFTAQNDYNASSYNAINDTSGETLYATTKGTWIALDATIENFINSSSDDDIISNSAANVFGGYGFLTTTGNDTIEGANNLDTLDLSAFTSASVTQTQSGNNLLLGLGSGRSVTVKDYYVVPASSRINLQFSSLGTLSILKTTDGAETGLVGSVFTLTRTGDLTAALNVSYSLGGTATVGSDYTDSSAGTATFAAGSATATITLPTIDDAVVDPNETIIATITAPTGYTISGSTSATATITDNDSLTTSVTLAVGPKSVLEDGTTNLVYTFTRTGDTTNALSVNYIVGGTATFNTDYTQTGGQISTSTFTTPRGTITFAAGANTANLTINPTADTTIESNETVSLRLAKGLGYDIGTATAVVGTIINDDLNDSLKASVTLAVGPSSVTEDGTTNLVYTFTRTGDTTNALTANYAVGGTAIFNSDYTQTGATSFASTNGSITFAAGVNTANIIIDPTADSIIESNETVAVRLVAGTGYSIGTTTAKIGTIINDDFSSVLTSSSVFGSDQSLFQSAGLLTSPRDLSLVA